MSTRFYFSALPRDARSFVEIEEYTVKITGRYYAIAGELDEIDTKRFTFDCAPIAQFDVKEFTFNCSSTSSDDLWLATILYIRVLLSLSYPERYLFKSKLTETIETSVRTKQNAVAQAIGAFRTNQFGQAKAKHSGCISTKENWTCKARQRILLLFCQVCREQRDERQRLVAKIGTERSGSKEDPCPSILPGSILIEVKVTMEDEMEEKGVRESERERERERVKGVLYQSHSVGEADGETAESIINSVSRVGRRSWPLVSS
ncbi:hypothetical protein K0M31_003618 [Melipona bicolor]|uniref:Uncharacterized protein n=1 Tax=Melipona bicolor TaxID=60889 RepID=A0AA40FZD4_9HYME|nr:hypothetical protein K0M31_003618 [Melipona bicolor]